MTTIIRAWLVLLGVVVIGVPPAAAQHAGHEHDQSQQQPKEAEADHSHHRPAPRDLPPFIPPITDEDRQAAFPRVEGHTVHDRTINYFLLFEQLEWQSMAGGTGLNVETKGWIGGDRDRVWFRVEGDGDDGRIGEAEAHLLYGRHVSRWWDLVFGARHDVDPGPAQTWAAFGIQGLAPYWFEVELTGYVGASGRTHLRGEVEYELLLTNRVVLQPLVEVNLFGKSDPARGVGAGLGTTTAGIRLRYELRRELAPYVGVTWDKKWNETADLAKAAGEGTGGARVVGGLRIWF